MKAAVCERYGPPEVVQIREVPTPAPADREVLVKALAATVNSGDARLRALRVPRGMSLPVRLQMGVTRPRQPVFGVDEVGAIAEIPESLSYQDAASLGFGGVTALDFFRRGRLVSGETVLINGASGAVGAMAVQLAKHSGAEVTAVCSAANADLVTGLGADHVIDYTAEDFTRNGQRYDVIMDTHGNAPYARVKNSLKPGGRFLMVFGDLFQTVASTWQRATIGGTAKVTGESYRTLMSLAQQGVLKPVIDTLLPVEQIVEAHRRVDGGHKV